MDMEQLSLSEPNVVSRTLAILLGDDYREAFLPRILGLIELPGAAEISMAGQPTFFTRPLQAYLRHKTARPEQAGEAQREINRFLGLPETFQLRRNTNDKLTHPRGWNRNFVAEMLNDRRNEPLVSRYGLEIVEAKLWLMEEIANTEVDLIIQAGGILLFCEIKWLSAMGGSSRKAALREYDLDQLKRQYLCGLYLRQASQHTDIEEYHQLVLTLATAPSNRIKSVDLGKLHNLVPGCARFFPLYLLTWRDVANSAADCLGKHHPLVEYLLAKKAGSGRGLHASGHASGPQLMDMIKRIQPQKVIPVHTEDPEAFVEGLENTVVEVHVPILGEEIRL